MSTENFTYKPQSVDYLGFLEAQLRDLQGIAILAYELIQNADDVRDDLGRSHASWISFDLTDEALIVENDGVFRAVDFERLQNIAGGGKREEAGTTGAFGLGFIAVYQVTDAPEIFSNNLHWIIRPDAAPDQRIQERIAKTVGTRLRLPWAFQGRSPVRRTLRIDAIRLDQLDELASDMGAAIELAALFLRRLRTLEVKRNGVVVRKITRMRRDDDQLLLEDEAGQSSHWTLFSGDFAREADELRARYPWQIEEHRLSTVRLAIPAEGLHRQGRLFAILPSESTTPLPFHINADFYPTTDRKRIHFAGGYQAEWNRAAISCAARTIAQHFDRLPAHLGPNGLWQLLQQMADAQQMADQGDLPDVFGAFWLELLPLLKTEPIIYTSQATWEQPAGVRLLDSATSQAAVVLLEALQIPIVHPDLAPYTALMRRPEIGVQPLTMQDITRALTRIGLTQTTPLFNAPHFLRTLAALGSLWALIDTLLSDQLRADDRAQALDAISRFSLVLTDLMMLDRLDRVYRGRPETRVLFPDVAWVHDLVPDNAFPGRYVPDFGVRQAVTLLAEQPLEQLEEAWRLGRLDLPGLFRWFESQQIEIFADDPALQQEICRLPLCPVAGELRPLRDLYIPGDFADPLKLSILADLEALGGRRQFLADLGVRELDFDAYLYEQLPQVLVQELDLPSDARYELLQLLAERLGEFRDDDELREQLSGLPLIPCMDGSFRPANEVYASRDVITLLGDMVHVAEPVSSRAIQALHDWLGVNDQPTAADIIQQLLAISKQWDAGATPLDTRTAAIVAQCWLRLSSLLDQQQLSATALQPLAEQQRHPLITGICCAGPISFSSPTRPTWSA